MEATLATTSKHLPEKEVGSLDTVFNQNWAPLVGEEKKGEVLPAQRMLQVVGPGRGSPAMAAMHRQPLRLRLPWKPVLHRPGKPPGFPWEGGRKRRR